MNPVIEQALASYVIGMVTCFPMAWIIFIYFYFILLGLGFWFDPVGTGYAVKESMIWWRWLVTFPSLLAGILTIKFSQLKIRRKK